MVLSPKCTVLSFRGPCLDLGRAPGKLFLNLLLDQLRIESKQRLVNSSPGIQNMASEPESPMPMGCVVRAKRNDGRK
jgi:hypothetical protein